MEYENGCLREKAPKLISLHGMFIHYSVHKEIDSSNHTRES